MISRFAPSTTGEAHPGTLLSALLVWLDARARAGRVVLRLEDLDRTRAKPGWADELVDALVWLGLDWDATVVQSGRANGHGAALDRLAAQGLLYPCTCSRADRAGGRPSPDGGWAYENTCRGRELPAGGWRDVDGNVRVRLPDDRVELVDDGGLDLSQTPAVDMGDPIVRRRDRVIAYQLAVCVDDSEARISDVVRGRDIAPSTATQVLLLRLLGLPRPHYRHHFLLLEASGDKRGQPIDARSERSEDRAHPGPSASLADKLAKLHGSIPFGELRARHTGPELCGLLAHAAGLTDDARACTPRDLVEGFAWSRVPPTISWRASIRRVAW